jgi:hypothetical protein
MHNQALSLPPFDYRFKTLAQKPAIFDVFRKKYVHLTPEEWVRQHLLHFLCAEKAYPAARISVEKRLQVEGQDRRYDAVVFGPKHQMLLLVECKAPSVPLNQQVFDQAARYNRILEVPFLLISNGLQHHMVKVDHVAGRYLFASDLLSYPDLVAEL